MNCLLLYDQVMDHLVLFNIQYSSIDMLSCVRHLIKNPNLFNYVKKDHAFFAKLAYQFYAHLTNFL